MPAPHKEQIEGLKRDLEEMSKMLDAIDTMAIGLWRRGDREPMSLYTSVLCGHLLMMLRACGTKERAEEYMRYAVERGFETGEEPTKPGGN